MAKQVIGAVIAEEKVPKGVGRERSVGRGAFGRKSRRFRVGLPEELPRMEAESFDGARMFAGSAVRRKEIERIDSHSPFLPDGGESFYPYRPILTI